jgi:hypothetical protein
VGWRDPGLCLWNASGVEAKKKFSTVRVKMQNAYGVTSSESRNRFAFAEFTQALRPVTMTM